MKVLCSSTPMEGVSGPFVPLGKALLAAGHDVVATGPDLEQRVRREGFATAVAGPAAMEGRWRRWQILRWPTRPG